MAGNDQEILALAEVKLTLLKAGINLTLEQINRKFGPSIRYTLAHGTPVVGGRPDRIRSGEVSRSGKTGAWAEYLEKR